MILTTNSNGEDDAPSRRLERQAALRAFREFNACHTPAGTPQGGQFCAAPGGAAARPKPTQSFGRVIPTAPSTYRALAAVRTDPTIPEKQKEARLFEVLRKVQPELVAEVRALLQRGAKGYAEFNDALREVAGRLRFATHHNIEAPEVAQDADGYVVIGSVKGLERSAVKVATDYAGDVRQLKDALRGTIVVRNGEEFVDTLAQLSRVATIEHIKDNLTTPTSNGYRDLNVLIRLPGSGMLAEIQLLSKPMLRAKAGLGHKLYKAWRNLHAESSEAKVLERRQARLYNRAWAMTAASAAATAAMTAGLTAMLQSLGLR